MVAALGLLDAPVGDEVLLGGPGGAVNAGAEQPDWSPFQQAAEALVSAKPLLMSLRRAGGTARRVLPVSDGAVAADVVVHGERG